MTDIDAVPSFISDDERLHVDARELAWINVRMGHPSSLVAEMLADEWGVDEDVADDVAHRLVRERALRLVHAGRPTGNLDRAFAELRGAGVLARGPVGFTLADLQLEIHDDAETVPGHHVWVGFHEQDAERFLDGGRSFLGFGPCLLEDAVVEDEEILGILRDVVVPTLEKHCMTVEWDGTMGTRLTVAGAGIVVVPDLEDDTVPGEFDFSWDDDHELLVVRTEHGPLAFARPLPGGVAFEEMGPRVTLHTGEDWYIEEGVLAVEAPSDEELLITVDGETAADLGFGPQIRARLSEPVAPFARELLVAMHQASGEFDESGRRPG